MWPSLTRWQDTQPLEVGKPRAMESEKKKRFSADSEDFGDLRKIISLRRRKWEWRGEKNAIQKSQAVKLAADTLLFVWSLFLQRLLGERHWPWGIYSQLKVVLKLPAYGFKLLAGRLVITAYQKQQPHRYTALDWGWLACWSSLTHTEAALTAAIYSDYTALHHRGTKSMTSWAPEVTRAHNSLLFNVNIQVKVNIKESSLFQLLVDSDLDPHFLFFPGDFQLNMETVFQSAVVFEALRACFFQNVNFLCIQYLNNYLYFARYNKLINSYEARRLLHELLKTLCVEHTKIVQSSRKMFFFFIPLGQFFTLHRVKWRTGYHGHHFVINYCLPPDLHHLVSKHIQTCYVQQDAGSQVKLHHFYAVFLVHVLSKDCCVKHSCLIKVKQRNVVLWEPESVNTNSVHIWGNKDVYIRDIFTYHFIKTQKSLEVKKFKGRHKSRINNFGVCLLSIVVNGFVNSVLP